MLKAVDLQDLARASLGGDGVAMVPAMALALDTHFGGLQPWREAFSTLAQAHQGEAAWLLLVFRPRLGALVNLRLAMASPLPEDDLPILAMDLLAPGGVGQVLAQIDWAAVYTRYTQAVHAAGEPFGAGQAAVAEAAVLIDVRRAGVYQQASTVIPGARWCDPAAVGRWAAELPANRPVLVYCVYGHEVGRVTALRLRAAGVDARYLQGGIDGWVAAGQPTSGKPAAP